MTSLQIYAALVARMLKLPGIGAHEIEDLVASVTDVRVGDSIVADDSPLIRAFAFEQARVLRALTTPDLPPPPPPPPPPRWASRTGVDAPVFSGRFPAL